MLVSPSKITVWVCDADAISQITTRRNDFPKPIEIYQSLSIYGINVVTTEGAMWRHHRKITSPPFTEKNNHLVWAESLHQAQSMLTSWVGETGQGNKTVATVAKDTMRLSLHIISRAGFGVRLLWPGVETTGGEQGEEGADTEGHKMTYTDALSSLLHNMLWLMLLPQWLLKLLPFKQPKLAYQSFVEWGKHMNELFQRKKEAVRDGTEFQEGMDLMGALVKGAGITGENGAANGRITSEKDQASSQQLLSDDEILGNAYVFILAGHETTANAIHFSLLFLALKRSSQLHLQEDLDKIFDGTKIDQWDYERDIPKLFAGMTGAVLNEALRLIPPVVNIPKSTQKGRPQSLTVDGRKVTIPGGVHVYLDTAATHRNPKYWPRTSADDLLEFRPERWLIDASKSANGTTTVTHTTDSESEEIGGPQGADTSPSLLRPPKGAYLPFSEGYRACLGRRFAQVEVLAVLAVLFRDYTVELAVDEFASDEEVEKMPKGGEERQKIYAKAAERAKVLMTKGMGSILTLQMRDGQVPVRLVRRGEERFAF
ncbi:MAG: hypothetical protein M1836_000290 [Candelina mexicana]|nr:MAG: hypothetical protein M1836_000290 [Candelina mexicana]